MDKITLMLVDDHKVVRQGLMNLLKDEPDFSVVAEANDGLEALQLTEQLQPNVMLVDLAMPGLGGLEVIRRVRNRFSQIHVVVLSMYANEAFVLEALRNGAAGYILKDCPITEVVQGIREVAAGRRFLSSPLSQSNIETYLERSKTAPLDPYERLTSREREVLQLVTEGHTSIEISRRLFISSRTVEIHRRNIMRKLGVRNQAEMIRYALKKGILPDNVKLSPRRNPTLPKDTI